MSSIREGCRNAFLEGERRLVEAMFNCQVQTSQVKITQVFHVGLV
jgi:translation elongation factor EF-G